MCSFLNVKTNAKTDIYLKYKEDDPFLKLCLIFTAQKMILSLTVAAFFDSVAYVMVR